VSLLVVGSVAFDCLESPYGKVERALGGAATYFAVAASHFTHVNLVAIVGDDFTSRDAEVFRGRTIDTEGLERAAGKTFFWSGRYSENLNERITLATDLNVFADSSRNCLKNIANRKMFSSPTLRRICSATSFNRSPSGQRSSLSIP
jgi:Sugar kinases, ribokinase family